MLPNVMPMLLQGGSIWSVTAEMVTSLDLSDAPEVHHPGENLPGKLATAAASAFSYRSTVR